MSLIPTDNISTTYARAEVDTQTSYFNTNKSNYKTT